jgi:hypothetical protein
VTNSLACTQPASGTPMTNIEDDFKGTPPLSGRSDQPEAPEAYRGRDEHRMNGDARIKPVARRQTALSPDLHVAVLKQSRDGAVPKKCQISRSVNPTFVDFVSTDVSLYLA